MARYDYDLGFIGGGVAGHTVAASGAQEIPIFYWMILKDGKRKVYDDDVVVENVSLVQNYRPPFNDILGTDTPEQPLEILQKKVKAQQEETGDDPES